MLHFIELTSNYTGPPETWDNEPTFHGRLWPLMLKHLDAVQRVYLFVNRYWRGHMKGFAAGSKISPNIADIGPPAQLSKAQLKEIEGRSFFGGSLNVLYQIAALSPTLEELFRLWPHPGKLADEGLDDLGFNDQERQELARLVDNVKDNYVLVSFAFEANSVYVFGAPTTLESLMKTLYGRGTTMND